MKNNATATFDGISDFQLYLFNEGTNYRAYEMLGAHPYEKDGKKGFRFSVWAPNAKQVYLVGTFNNWHVGDVCMSEMGKTGVWYVFSDSVSEGDLYKYVIEDSSGQLHYKADPFAFYSELRPGTASAICDIEGFKWKDKKWFEKKKKNPPYNKPMLIYEMHMASWKHDEDGNILNYRDVADKLIPYLKEMGYTHLELMPITEYPFDGSWGYQVTGYFSATSRYGEPKDLMYFIDKCHKNNISVILDWVPAHFPRDAHGLRMFDGTPLFEYADPRLGEHKDWGTMVFDFSKNEVISFLISSAHFWFDKYHIDGLRVDAVSSMLYRDYSRNDGEWVANKYGGNENLEAIEFLKTLNKTIFSEFPEALMIAEESTAWPMITKPVHEGGLGFNYKWNMGWMNDTLRYMSMDPYFRKFNHNILTFLMCYAFSENYILPLSHDEVVHGKRSLIDKMHGTYEEKFAGLKMYYAYFYAHPGKKLLFMGGEFGQFVEWRPAEELDWMLLEYDSHKNLHNYVKHLNKLYQSEKALWEIEDSWDGFSWINEHDENNSVLSFVRFAKSKANHIVVINNFTPVERIKYKLGVPSGGVYEIILNSDDISFGGKTKLKQLTAKKGECDGFKNYIELDLPPLSTLYLKKHRKKKTLSNKKEL